METKPAVHIRNISHAYRETPVLRNVSAKIPEGAFFIIIGPNGSGKTTLLKTICGLEPVREGEISILGSPIHHYSKRAAARLISFVPQTPPANLPFTVLETVTMGRFPHLGALGMETRADVNKARHCIDVCGIAPLSGRKLTQLSGGERQRVFIARALCQEPKLLLLDEPTASLDLSHQVRIMDLLEELIREKDLTVVMVSHDINLAAMYADQLLLLKSGEVFGNGPPGEVLTYSTLEKAYGCTILVDESPMGGVPRITLVPRKFMIE